MRGSGGGTWDPEIRYKTRETNRENFLLVVVHVIQRKGSRPEKRTVKFFNLSWLMPY
jgi:hypothetical protein